MLHDHIHQASGRSKELVQNHLQQWSNVHLEQYWLQVDTKLCKRKLQVVRLLAQNLTVKLVQRLQNEVNEGSVLFRVRRLASEFAGFSIEVYIAPETIGKSSDIYRALERSVRRKYCMKLAALPYVSAYICANERSVKHQCISVLANATLPFSGLRRRAGSGSIPLRFYSKLRT